MLTCRHYCTFMEEIFLINLYGSKQDKAILKDFLDSNQADKLKILISIAGRIKKCTK